MFGKLEGNQVGMTFENASQIVANYSYTYGIIMLLVSFFVFLLLAAYFDAVLPKTYGERKSVCFCFPCCRRKDKLPSWEEIDVSIRRATQIKSETG